MAKVKPLTLKSEKSSPRPVMIEDRPYVDVLVNLPYLSSEEIYTYFLPQGCEGSDVGHLVAVSFGSHQTDGLIVRRYSDRPDHGSIKPISLLISEMRIFSDQQIALARELAMRYVTSTWSFLSAFSPAYSKLGLTKYSRFSQSETVAGPSEEDIALSGLILPDALNRRLRSQHHLRDLMRPASSRIAPPLKTPAASRKTLPRPPGHAR